MRSILEQGRLTGVVAEHHGERMEIGTDTLILAAGHSARDIFSMLYRHGALLEQKPFSIGMRIEHPQRVINTAQYGRAAVPELGAADYKLACHLESGRSVYTFCMCPGGEVVAAASESDGVAVNGMSRFARDGANANSALLVNVTPQDFGSPHPLAGVAFQRQYETGGICRRRADFYGSRPAFRGLSTGCPFIRDWQRFADVSAWRPFLRPGGSPSDFAVHALREAVPLFDAKLRGFALPDAVLTGVETRSSSPVRILRGEDMQASLRGVFPCGEGAGYAGGIMSAAVDGIRVAQAVLQTY